MIQFVKYATIDPVGFAVVKLDDVTSIESTADADVCKVTHAHGDLLVEGTIEHHVDMLAALVGGAWDAVPVVVEVEA